MPFIQFADYEPDFVGIRPEFQKPGDGIMYFVINNEKISGYDNFINLIGIEPPGLTSSIAIGNHVRKIIN